MSCLSLLNLTGRHIPGLYWQSADVPLVCSSCGKLVLLTFHKAQACEVPKFMTALTLVLFCRASKTFQVGGIFTFAASIFLLVCTSGIKGLLVIACLSLICIFVLCGPWLGLGLPLLVFTMWQFSVLMSHKVNFGSLHFPCNLLDMSHCGL